MKTIPALTAIALLLASAELSCMTGGDGVIDRSGQPQDQLGKIEEYRAALDRPGPEAAEARQAAIDNLLGMMDLRAQGVLQDKLRQAEDADGVREVILQSLARRLGNDSDPVFGSRAGDERREQRRQVVKSYVPALVPFFAEAWRENGSAKQEPQAAGLRDLARACLVKLPQRDLADALREYVESDRAVGEKTTAFCAAADSQDLFFARFLARFIESEDPELRAAARHYLQLLTFSRIAISTTAAFDAWLQKHGSKTYKQLAEEAARTSTNRIQKLEDETARRVEELTLELVSALLDNRMAVDWNAIQKRVLQPEPPGLMKACLTLVRDRLRDELHTGTNGVRERQAFHQALLTALDARAAGAPELRALLVETSAYLLRPGEGEVATEMEKRLTACLDDPSPILRQAGLRGLARFPSPRNRAAVLSAAERAIENPDTAGVATLRVALQTLGRRSNPPWVAPSAEDADKPRWLALLGRIFDIEALAPLRSEALEVARLTDATGTRLPGVFQLLLAAGGDHEQPFEVRKLSLIYLQDYTSDQEARADTWVRTVVKLLADPVPEIREFAAQALFPLPDHSDKKKRDWIESLLIGQLRARLLVEDNTRVFETLVACVTNCARPPGRPDISIGTLQHVLDKINGNGQRHPDELRIGRLTQALTSLAVEPIDAGQWIPAGESLWHHKERLGLRLVLSNQKAVLRASEVAAAGNDGELARRAMVLVIRAALLKPDSEPWSSPGLAAEASEVEKAFAALETVKLDPDDPESRWLRLDVLAGLSRHGEVIALGKRYLAPDDKPRSGTPLPAALKDRVRLRMVAAHLSAGQVPEAETAYLPVDASRATTPEALPLGEHLGRALLTGANPQPARALPILDRVFTSTRQDDPRYRHRLLILAQALAGVDGNRERLLKLLSDNEARFTATDCPAALKQQFEALRQRIRAN